MTKIKDLFVPAPGHEFISADYNQIEFRTVCCLAKEPFLKAIFDDPNRDVFGELAEEMFGASWGKPHRQILKRVCHGTNYGMEAKTMTEQINGDAKNFGVDLCVQVYESKKFQREYIKRVPKVKRWQEGVKNKILKTEDDLITPFGRRRRFPLTTPQNKYKVIHEALAFMPQSIASDICLKALMELHYRLPEGCFVRLSVHDSIMVECPIELHDCVSSLMEEIMIASAERFSTYCKFAIELQWSTESWGKLHA
jgi:DNA polymerase I